MQVFTLGGMGQHKAIQIVGAEVWDEMTEDGRNDVLWAGQTGDGDGYNPGAMTAISSLMKALLDEINKEHLTTQDAQYLWASAVDPLRPHNVFGPYLWVLFKDYSEGDPMRMLNYILNESEEFLLAREGRRR